MAAAASTPSQTPTESTVAIIGGSQDDISEASAADPCVADPIEPADSEEVYFVPTKWRRGVLRSAPWQTTKLDHVAVLPAGINSLPLAGRDCPYYVLPAAKWTRGDVRNFAMNVLPESRRAVSERTLRRAVHDCLIDRIQAETCILEEHMLAAQASVWRAKKDRHEREHATAVRERQRVFLLSRRERGHEEQVLGQQMQLERLQTVRDNA
eukprot:TRINITY_DN58837_c0_g1_i1.p1 TRINITY_DN58837_c0_g1~~TRINITY_DN58837_c0_g1_i1.p1  ORF type:complete len:210 (-),score=31.47 TRINITY_DN58837_c0_g1_i1:656-1285(-)